MTVQLATLLRRILLVSSATAAAACGGRALSTIETSEPDAGASDDAALLSDAASASDEAGTDADAASCAYVGDGGLRYGSCWLDGQHYWLDGYVQCDHPISMTAEDCASICPPPVQWAHTPADDGGSECSPDDAGLFRYNCYVRTGDCAGRRPEGFVASTNDGFASAVGAFFASLAELEAASVDAFEILARELDAHDAPHALRSAAKRSARDEVQHARITAALARRYGGCAPSRPIIEQREPRALEAIAFENIVEGCVRETFGALVAMAQAERAGDPAIRKAMRGIAEDETRHAELSWAIASWIHPLLSSDQQGRVQDAMIAAIDELEVASTQSIHPDLVEVAGLPPAAMASRMIAELRASLWSDAA